MMLIEYKIEQIIKLNQLLWPDRTLATKESMSGLFAQMLEEAGEFRQATRNYLGRKYAPEKKGTINDIIEEGGDLLSLVLVVLWIYDIDIFEALDRVIAKLENIRIKREAEAVVRDLPKYNENIEDDGA